ncbi:MAG: hypothetical protein JXQ99_19910 [Hyphomicrobiaceae bacterium]
MISMFHMVGKTKLSMPNNVVVILTTTALYFGLAIATISPIFASDGALQLEKSACYIFGGREDCRTVRVFDAEECIVKLYPKPLPNIDPAELACLRDEVETKKLNLRKALPRNLTISGRINVAGPGAVEVLVRFDKNGAAVWASKPADTFELKSDPLRARRALRRIATELCVGPSRMVGGGTNGGEIGAKEAFKSAAEGKITLVDIRLLREWRRTGVGANAIPITMHQNIYRFVERLKEVTAGNDRPIALICAEGVRSATMQKTLMEFGFKGVIDVHDGMEGNRAGTGWIKSGLPVTSYSLNKAEAVR